VRFHRQIVHRLLVELKMIPEERSAETCFAPARKPGEIRVALYNCAGTGGDSAYVVERCLVPFERANCRRITDAAIRRGALDQFDVVVFPGGTGSGTARALGDAGRKEVRRFVREGGGYLGICAGAYLATSHYRWSLGILDARVVDDAHWARGNGTVRIGLTEKGAALFGVHDKSVRISYRQGPLLAPGEQPGIEDFELLASYESEIPRKGVPRGVMVGTAAIVRGRFGKGRVLAMSPHPEKTKGLTGFVRSAVAWLGN
jgi:glutamine amidotransferase-like uncharacterized protein